ncbi:MerR family transcriptional regulator [Kitasatospora sp. NPDC057223]|uniref:DNA polymerase III subunit beta family protein n=1 Tax=Kitasatospora sp. NPDC057223 TaxID=3346055 RepID=UPI0036411AA6
MESDMRSIGEMARDSGLTVSALRYYDGADVFGPAWVDPQTGYRWYEQGQLADARLLSRLRRVGLPLADIRLVLDRSAGSAAAHRVVDAHLRRLENGLADARRELSFIRALLDQRENPVEHHRTETRVTVDAAALAAALDAVRFAVGGDPEQPALAGVLFEIEGELLRLVATDRYRLAVAEAAVAVADGGPAAAIVPAALVDGARALLAGGGRAELTLGGATVALAAGGHRIEGAALDHDYPDYRRLVRLEPARRVETTTTALRQVLADAATRRMPRTQDGVDCEIAVLSIAEDGTLGADDGRTPDAGTAEGGAAGTAGTAGVAALRVAVDREFLLDAIRAGASEQLVLELGGPIAPLAIRTPGSNGTFSLLMPVRLTEPASA